MKKAAETKITINKFDCVEKQLETALELFFQDCHHVPIHTLTAAAYNVIKDLRNHRQDGEMLIKRKLADQFGIDRKDINEPENFFKHADNDPEGELTYYYLFTELLLFEACMQFERLTSRCILQFSVYQLWMWCYYEFELRRIPKELETKLKPLFKSGKRREFHDCVVAHVAKEK